MQRSVGARTETKRNLSLELDKEIENVRVDVIEREQ